MLQEAQSREFRKNIGERIKSDRASSKKKINDYISAFDEEINAKDSRISELENALSDALSSVSDQTPNGVGIISEEFNRYVGKELYDGEISDRIRYAIKNYMNEHNIIKSNRETHLLKRFLEIGSFSGRSLGLISEIKSAGRDSNEMPARMGAIFSRLGFHRSEEGKHLKFSPPSGLGGIDVVILPKTPSDYRSGKNQASDLIENFSIRNLHKE